MQILRNRAIVTDNWRHEDETLAGVPVGSLPPGSLVVGVERWRADAAALARRPYTVGVHLGPDEEAELVANDVQRFGVIVIAFEGVTDGRPYTRARLLRERFGYRGELRARGDVTRDRVVFMERCGINAFEIDGAPELRAALAVLERDRPLYQPGADRRPTVPERRGYRHPVSHAPL